MAKWGSEELDPRWIVDERADGKNVGSWHWETINRFEWTKARLAELLEGLAVGGGAVRVTKVRSVTGEAVLTRRKKDKVFAMYDLAITCKWEGAAAGAGGGGEPCSGELKILEFASLSEPDEVLFEVSGGDDALRRRHEAELRAEIFRRLETFAADINASAAAGAARVSGSAGGARGKEGFDAGIDLCA